ncbi:MAG: AAA family ATPase [Mariprofundaceae bacterium]
MYCKFFTLNELPFLIAPDPRYLYMGDQQREALAHLLYGVGGEGGFVLLTGEVGTGKTTLCRCLLEQIPDHTDIAFIINPKLSSVELLCTICDELSISTITDRSSIKGLTDSINQYILHSHAQGRSTILIIDEAQHLSRDVLEQLRLLTNLETNKKKLLQIILLGQPELNTMLASTELRQFSQRIIARYHLMPLAADEISDYITHRLSVAGCHDVLFSTRAITSVFRLSQGIPRLINTLCDRALLGAYTQELKQVNKETMVQAGKELFGHTKQYQKRSGGVWKITTGVTVMLATLMVVIWYGNISVLSPFTADSREDNTNTEPPSWLSERKQLAWQALFAQWNIDYEPEQGIDACQFAQQHRLQCLDQRGSMAMLRHTGRPALLHFTGEHGEARFATIIAIGGSHGRIQSGHESSTVKLADIQRMWFGDYTLLWRPPPHGSGSIKPGASGMAVSWLYEQLLLLDEGNIGNKKDEDQYDDVMTERVRVFQRQQNLSADGIAGALTWIHLNSATGKPVAQLGRL